MAWGYVNVPGKPEGLDNLENAVTQMNSGLSTIQRSVEGASYYQTFRAADWNNGELRIPKSKHGMKPRQTACLCQLRQLTGSPAAYATTWGTMSSQVSWDLSSQELVVRASTPFPGDLLVMGRADTGA